MPYTLKLSIPQTYPDKPPFVTFLDPIYHLNIHPSTGQLNMSILSQDWSPFLNLIAIITSLDEILQQPDQTHPATKDILEEYQTDITAYVDNVKAILQQNIPKKDNDHSQQQQLYTQEQVEQVIQVQDFSSDYKIKRPGSNFDQQQNQQNFRKQLQFLGAQRNDEDKLHDYSFNHEAAREVELANGNKEKRQQKLNEQQLTVKMDKSKQVQHIELQVNSPVEKSINNNRKKNPGVSLTNNEQSSLIKYETIRQPNRKLTLQQDKHQRSYEGLKQNMVRCKQLITIFSNQLNQMQQNIENSKSKRIKKMLQEKCSKLEQMIIELFQINSKTQAKLIDLVRNGVTQYL